MNDPNIHWLLLDYLGEDIFVGVTEDNFIEYTEKLYAQFGDIVNVLFELMSIDRAAKMR